MKISFYDWCISNNHEELLRRWDYDLNQQTPESVGYRTNEKYYLKCPNGVHLRRSFGKTKIQRLDQKGTCVKK